MRVNDKNNNKVGFWGQRKAAFGFALSGLVSFWQSGSHPKIQISAAVLGLALGAYLGLNNWEWAVLILSITLVLSLEAMNSALEYSLDLCHPQWHPLAKKAKDIAAAAVLLAALCAAILGLIIFLPKIIHYEFV